jgi:cob(I)alamin adenosyltransferase
MIPGRVGSRKAHRRASGGSRREIVASRTVRIYTKTGDTGETSLFGGGRVPKDATRVSAYGAVDELNASVGWVGSIDPQDFEGDLLESVQADLFAIGAQLSAPNPESVEKSLAKANLPDERVAVLEKAIDEAEAVLEPLSAFVLPGGTAKAAALHVSRAACRRAERAIVLLHHGEPVPPEILRYINRLSDLLFVLARLANHQAGVPDRTW